MQSNEAYPSTVLFTVFVRVQQLHDVPSLKTMSHVRAGLQKVPVPRKGATRSGEFQSCTHAKLIISMNLFMDSSFTQQQFATISSWGKAVLPNSMLRAPVCRSTMPEASRPCNGEGPIALTARKQRCHQSRPDPPWTQDTGPRACPSAHSLSVQRLAVQLSSALYVAHRRASCAPGLCAPLTADP